MDSLRGQFLIAPPHLTDPNFSRSVVLMIQHDENGAFGLVLNRPSGKTVAEIWGHVHGDGCTSMEPVHVGGPVAGPLLALHAEETLADLQVADGVYCSTRPEALAEFVNRHADRLRFFAGYAGWGGGQLEGELQTGSWLTAPASASLVFEADAQKLWDRVFREAVDSTSWDADPFASQDDPTRN